jgi:predicted permease
VITRRRSRRDDALEAELRDHLERLSADYVREGATAAEARRRARLAFGGEAVTEACRDERGGHWVETLGREVRLAVRGLLAARTFTVMALLILMLGIGATTTIYSVVDAVVLRGLPFPHADRLVAISEMDSTQPGNAAPQNFFMWRERQTSFRDIAAVAYGGTILPGDGVNEPERLNGEQVTANFFDVLGVMPLVGAPFSAANEVDGNARVAVISYGLWQRRFGGAPDVVGRRLPNQLGDFRIVGVMPPGFSYPVGARDSSDVWTPLVISASGHVRGHDYSYYLQVIARLRDGVSVTAAQTELSGMADRLRTEAPAWYRPVLVQPLHAFVTGPARRWMWLLLGAVICLLLVACVNLAVLMLVRTSARNHELGIRAALGASRRDLARAVVIEALVLSLAGAGLGIGFAWLGGGVLRAALPADVPRAAAIAVDGRVLAVTMLVALVTGVLFSLAPVWQIACQVMPAIRTRGQGRTSGTEQHRLRGALIVAQVALAAVLVIGAGLFVASFVRVSRIDLGVDTRDVLTVRMRPLVGPWNVRVARRDYPDRLQDVLAQARAISGVEAAALVAGGLPFRGDLRTAAFGVPGRALGPNTEIDLNQVSPDYFRVLRVPLRRGRPFTDADRAGAEPVVILNAAAAGTYFPDGDPIGRMVDFQGPRRVVGVIGNIRHDGPETAWRREGFVPFAQSQMPAATIVLRISRPIGEVLPPLKAAIRGQFPDLALPDIEMLGDYLRSLTAWRRASMLVLGLFGVLGLSMAATGIYGVMAYTVVQRTPEIGVRLAIGASPSAILREVLGRAGRQLTRGLAIGLVAAWGVSQLAARFLFQMTPHDPVVYAGAFLVLLVAGLGAALGPARRASRVDPLIALRLE